MTDLLQESLLKPGARRTTHARHRVGRLAIALSVVATLFALAGTPVLAANSSPSLVATQVTAATPQTRTVDVSRDAAAVLQYNSYSCVPAAVQTMLNIVNGQADRSRATQARLYAELRRANLYSYVTRGNDVRGWARVLTAHLPRGLGYADVSFTSRTEAYLAIVKAIDRTRKPVGIVVDRASHAWTVVGFKVQETPGVPNSTTILGFYVVGPLGSPTDPWPKKYLTVAQLNARFTPYHEAQRSVLWEGLYVIVAPVSTVGRVVVTR